MGSVESTIIETALHFGLANNIFAKDDARQMYEILSFSGNVLPNGQYHITEREDEIIAQLKDTIGTKILEPLLQSANGGKTINDEEEQTYEDLYEDSNVETVLTEEQRETLRQQILPVWREGLQFYQPMREKVIRHIEESMEAFDDLMGTSSLEEVDA